MNTSKILYSIISLLILLTILIGSLYRAPSTANAASPPPPIVKEYQVGSDKILFFAVPHPTKKGTYVNCVVRHIIQCDF